ncbi:5-formyltetrahydrofolate cyclo-ligase [Chitinibacteraceae bacterium HSL-7]
MFPHTDSPQNKQELRRHLRRTRQAIAPSARCAAALAIRDQLLRLGALKRGQRLAGYMAAGSELSLLPTLLTALVRGCQVYLPHTPKRGRRMHFARLDHASHWYRGNFGISEVVHTDRVRARQLDVVLVPLLGFDTTLARMGQGGGYYDATFHFRRNRKSWRRPLLVGIAFDEQQILMLPAERWDLRLDMIVTPSRILRFSNV